MAGVSADCRHGEVGSPVVQGKCHLFVVPIENIGVACNADGAGLTRFPSVRIECNDVKCCGAHVDCDFCLAGDIGLRFQANGDFELQRGSSAADLNVSTVASSRTGSFSAGDAVEKAFSSRRAEVQMVMRCDENIPLLEFP